MRDPAGVLPRQRVGFIQRYKRRVGALALGRLLRLDVFHFSIGFDLPQPLSDARHKGICHAEPQEFMERPCDSRAGYKHHQTRDYLTAMQKGIMEIAQREGLHQVDLLNPAPVKNIEREYWKTRREQEKLDELNSRIIADGMKPRTTTYQTQKQFLRDAVTDAASLSLSLEQFRRHFVSMFEGKQARPEHLRDLILQCETERDNLETPAWMRYIESVVDRRVNEFSN